MARIIWLTCGIVALGLGVIGLLLPVVPTTPFLLVAAGAFSKSSRTFHNLLLTNKYTGPIIKDWQTNRKVPLKAIIAGIIMMSISAISLFYYFYK